MKLPFTQVLALIGIMLFFAAVFLGKLNDREDKHASEPAIDHVPPPVIAEPASLEFRLRVMERQIQTLGIELEQFREERDSRPAGAEERGSPQPKGLGTPRQNGKPTET